jgi:ADP-heptose:LPS heptosyltransferase
MKVNSMRFLDRWVGAPVSAVLTVVRKTGDILWRKTPLPPRRIIVVKLVEQGATVIAEPALRRATEMVGRGNVFMVVFKENRFILDVLDVIPEENVITIRSDGLVVLAIDSLRALWRMRRERIDTAIDFEFFSRFSGALTYLSGASRRIGFHSFAGEAGYRGDLMTHRVAYNLTLHASETYRALVEAAAMDATGLPAMDFRFDEVPAESKFVPRTGEVEEVESLLKSLLGRETIPPLVLLNANSGDLLPLRRWAVERYVEMAKKLLARYPDIIVAFTGAPDERTEAEYLAGQVDSERCVSFGGRTTLRQLMVLYGLAEVLVTNDSGPAHYATLTSIDVVTLFGPETPAIFGARTPRSHIVWTGLACSPCVNAFNQRITTCTNNMCMQRITVAQVFATVCRVLEQRYTGESALKIAPKTEAPPAARGASS